MEERKTIAILGAGFGGLRAAKVLARNLKKLNLLQKYEVILIDRNDHHTYTPLLYEVATTSKETANMCDLHSVATYTIRSLIAKTDIRFIQKEIKSIDPMHGSIHFTDGETLNSSSEAASSKRITKATGSNVFFKTGTTETHAGTEKFIADARIKTDGTRHFSNIRTRTFAKSSDGIDGGDALRQKSIGNQFG